MRYLVIDNVKIKTPILDIVKEIKHNLFNGKLAVIKEMGDNIRVTCPHHKNGLEKKAASDIYIGDDENLEYGWFKCFVCNFQGPFYHFVAECFDKDDIWAKNWLINNFGGDYVDTNVDKLDLKEIKLTENTKDNYLDEHILDSFESFHPYMLKRKLTKEVCEKFQVKYDPETESIVFPVRDESGKLWMLTRRSVNNKTFIIDKDKEKPVYLLYYLKENNIDSCIVTESQINCLTCCSYGLPAVALFGTGSEHQYDLLNNSNIRYYVLCFDGDSAGYSGMKKFIKNIRKDVFIDVVQVPRGKDVNDLSKEEFMSLLRSSGVFYEQLLEKGKKLNL